MQTTKPTQNSLDQASLLSPEEIAELARKFASRSSDRLTVARLTQLEQAALQLQRDDQALERWRVNMARVAEGLQDSRPAAS